MTKKKVLLICGGTDVEADVSRSTALSIEEAIKNDTNYEVIKYDFLPSTLKQTLSSVKPDVVLNAMCGKWGEDGVLQKILDYEQIPYSHSGYFASCSGMNKNFTCAIARAAGIKTTTNSRLITKQDLIDGNYIVERKTLIKPNSQGSSCGCYKLDIGQKLNEQQVNFVKNNTETFYIFEDLFVNGVDVTIGIFDNKIAGSVEAVAKSGFFDYEAKYTKGSTDKYMPPRIPASLLTQLEAHALTMHNLLQANHVSRSDFMVNPDGDYIFLETNICPAMTPTSFLPAMASHYLNIDYHNLVVSLIENASYREI